MRTKMLVEVIIDSNNECDKGIISLIRQSVRVSNAMTDMLRKYKDNKEGPAADVITEGIFRIVHLEIDRKEGGQ